jgi:Protein of unknown function (DUF3089).
MKKILAAVAAVLCLVSCGKNKVVSEYADESFWFQSGVEVNPDYADVLYYVSTEVLSSTDAEGDTVYRAVLNKDERAAITQEMGYMYKYVYKDSLNFFSPYYHQLTLDGYSMPEEVLQPELDSVYKECLEAFDYYMEHLNGGRPFILSGFSQGAMIVKYLLKNMSDKQFENMVAAYVIGYEITDEDLSSSHIVPAEGADDTGVTISFNSVCTVDSVWPLVYSNPTTCINPVNWCTDATPAPLMDGETSLSVAVDPEYNVVVVSGYGDNYPGANVETPWPKGNLHGQEILIYAANLGRNALDRANARKAAVN